MYEQFFVCFFTFFLSCSLRAVHLTAKINKQIFSSLESFECMFRKIEHHLSYLKNRVFLLIELPYGRIEAFSFFYSEKFMWWKNIVRRLSILRYM